jgi:hypothetical protein
LHVDWHEQGFRTVFGPNLEIRRRYRLHQDGVIVWTVFAPQASVAPGALTGDYVGGTASATVGTGVGANALVGGSNSAIASQPLSIEGNTGLNVAAGLAAVRLTYHPQTVN